MKGKEIKPDEWWIFLIVNCYTPKVLNKTPEVENEKYGLILPKINTIRLSV